MNLTINPSNPSSDEPILRYVLYARKSSEDVGVQAKSLPNQIQACVEYAENNGLKVIEILKESHLAKISGRRPIFSQMLKDIEAGKYDGILTWHPDRLARNSLEAGMIVSIWSTKASSKFSNSQPSLLPTIPTINYCSMSCSPCPSNIPSTSAKASSAVLIPTSLKANLAVRPMGLQS